MLTRKFFVDLHGCAKNQVDAEIIIGIMCKLGWQNAEAPEEADLIIVNSCGFIAPAKEESINAVIDIRSSFPNAKIILAGCLAERYAKLLKDELKEADAFFGNGDLSKLPTLIKELFPDSKTNPQIEENKRILKPEQKGISCGARPKVLNFPRSAYIKITEGCDNYCSFCAIPIIRGRLRSRPIDDIVEEIKAFIKKDFFEFNLIGQDLAAFQADTALSDEQDKSTKPALPDTLLTPCSGLAKLLKAISGIEGNFRIRLLYIHPDHFPPDILPIMTSDTRFLPYFDIPFQSGAKKIIKAMNRTGSAEIYLSMVEKIKHAFKKAKSPYGEPVIRTTFLLGFPGETDDDFKETVDFLKKLKTLWSGGFIYSKEEDTPAYSFKKQVPKKIAEKRLSEIQEIQTAISEKILDKFIGMELQVLVEEILEDNLALGRAWFQAPEVDGAVVLNLIKESEKQKIRPGDVVKAKILARRGFDLEAVSQQVETSKSS